MQINYCSFINNDERCLIHSLRVEETHWGGQTNYENAVK